MLTGLDHFIVVVPSPDDAAKEIEAALGIRAGPGGRHERYGSFNRLIWLGDSYIELLGIDDRELVRTTWFGPRALDVLDRAGAGYVGLVLASDDLDAEMEMLHQQGSHFGEPIDGERHRPDGRVVRWKAAVAREPDPEVGVVFLIEHDMTSAEWTPADRAERAREVHPLGTPVRLTHVELPVRDLRGTTTRLHRELGLQFRPSLVGGGARDASLGEQILRLVPATAGALPTVGLRGGSSVRELTAFGCRWLLEPVA
jgi:hypothetical protein